MTQTEQIKPTSSANALRAAAYEKYATATRLHNFAHTCYVLALRTRTEEPSVIPVTLTFASTALLKRCAAQTAYRAAKTNCILLGDLA